MQKIKSSFINVTIFITALMICTSIKIVNAATVYDMQIIDGAINTSGGITGTGIGTLSVSGTFRTTLTDTSIIFSDINIVTNPASSFSFPDYAGTYNGFSFSGLQTVPGFGTNSYNGTFDGILLNMAGEYSDPFADGIQFSFNVSTIASPVPVPGTLLLLLSGLSLIALRKPGSGNLS